MNTFIKNTVVNTHPANYSTEYLMPVTSIDSGSIKHTLNGLIRVKDNPYFSVNIASKSRVFKVPSYNYRRIRGARNRYYSLILGLFQANPNLLLREYSFCGVHNGIFKLSKKDYYIARSGLFLASPSPKYTTKAAPFDVNDDESSKLLFQLAFRKDTKYYTYTSTRKEVLGNYILDIISKGKAELAEFSPVMFVDFSIFAYPELYNITENDKKIFNIEHLYKKIKAICDEEGIEIIIVDNLFDMFYENISDNLESFKIYLQSLNTSTPTEELVEQDADYEELSI